MVMHKVKAKAKKGAKATVANVHYIIGIGASAGGMDAIHTLFDYTLTDAVSYIIIQHLSPDYKSFMAELLVKHSKLKIYKAETGMEVQSNCVYVMPEGKNMTISGGKLVLTKRQKSTVNSAVDIFFNSLAEDQGEKSIGIVLSGNGTDGTKGVAAIKKVDGMVIVQDPESTDYDSMPNSVIDSGNYDFILAPKLIPQQIINYVAQRALLNTFSDPDSGKDEPALLEIISIIKNHTPLDFSDYKRPTIVRRIIRRMAANNSTTIADYIELLNRRPAEVELLAKEFLISVTKFFRDPEAFELIRTKVIPELVANKFLVDTLKVWVIGCATGEEAFSLAILIKEHLQKTKKELEVKIFASDIDKSALAKAAKAWYPDSIRNEVSEKRLETFFTEDGKGFKVKDEIRKMIIFANHDIVHHPPYGKIDLISCRNLLIYLNPNIQKKIFSTLHYCLNIGGYLFLGPSEGTGQMKDAFLEVDKSWKIYKNIEESKKIGFSPFVSQPVKVMESANRPAGSKIPKSSAGSSDLPTLLSLAHLELTGYLGGVCLDLDGKVILPFGAYENYLLPKLFNDKLIELLPEGLAVAVATSLKKAISTNTTIAVNLIKYTHDSRMYKVKLLVKPLLDENALGQKMVVVYFGIDKSENKKPAQEEFRQEAFDKQHLADTKHELAALKRELQQAYRELDESKDNIQSFNEELVSGNEEMQSSNEELQSINEELNTVNSEYQQKIKELAELNDDFNNYFRSSYNAQVFVDKKLVIKKFTPVAIKQINIKESDLGRSLSDISTNIVFSSMLQDIREVIRTKISCEKQVETADGRWYAMVILPYIRSGSGKTDGAIITFNDITDMRASKLAIEESNSKLMKINEDHDTFIYSVAHDLKSPLNNMQGLLTALDESETAEKQKSIYPMIGLAVKRLQETIDELSDIARIDAETQQADSVEVTALLEEVQFSIRLMLLDARATLHVNLEEPRITFSKKNLRSILLNLLTNAAKYKSSERDLEVYITTRKKLGFIMLSVRDNGIGITTENQKQLFSKFKRAHNPDNAVKGEGIGLYLLSKIVTNAGSHIEVESTYGQGSTFIVYFKDV